MFPGGSLCGSIEAPLDHPTGSVPLPLAKRLIEANAQSLVSFEGDFPNFMAPCGDSHTYTVQSTLTRLSCHRKQIITMFKKCSAGRFERFLKVRRRL